MIHIRIESLLWFVSGCVFQDDGYKYSRATMITVKVLFFSFQLEFQAKSNFTIGNRIDIQISDRDIEKFTKKT